MKLDFNKAFKLISDSVTAVNPTKELLKSNASFTSKLSRIIYCRKEFKPIYINSYNTTGFIFKHFR